MTLKKTNFDVIIRRQNICTCDFAREAKSLGEMCQTVVTRRQFVHECDRQQRHLFWWQIWCTLPIRRLQPRPSSALLGCCHGSAAPRSEMVTFLLMADCLVIFNRTPLWADITAITGRQKCQEKNPTLVARSENHYTFWKWKSFKARK